MWWGAGFAAAIILIALLSGRYSWIIGFSFALMLLPLGPVVAAMRVYDQGNMTHDRYLYLPSVGLSLLCGWVGAKLWQRASLGIRNEVAVGTAILICGIGIYLTVTQDRYYSDDETHYQRAIAVCPSNFLVIDYLGDMYLSHGKPDAALKEFENAYELAPADDNVKFFLARGLFENQEYSQAKHYLRELADSRLLSDKRKEIVLFSLAHAELRLNEVGSAVSDLQRLHELDDKYTGLHRTLGTIYETQGRLLEAQIEYVKEYQASGDAASRIQALRLANFLSRSSQSPVQPLQEDVPISTAH